MIDFLDEPIAGMTFDFRVTSEDAGIISHKVSAFIAGRMVFENECPDPPCHETFYISEEDSDKILTIIYSNNLQNQTYDFVIKSKY